MDLQYNSMEVVKQIIIINVFYCIFQLEKTFKKHFV